jgi:hypothetical protein
MRLHAIRHVSVIDAGEVVRIYSSCQRWIELHLMPCPAAALDDCNARVSEAQDKVKLSFAVFMIGMRSINQIVDRVSRKGNGDF